MKEDTILTDTRPIRGLFYGQDTGWLWKSGDGVVIEAYGENAPYCLVPWFRIKKNGEVIARVPAVGLCVEYEKDGGT